jgi:hypothetical protein
MSLGARPRAETFPLRRQACSIVEKKKKDIKITWGIIHIITLLNNFRTPIPVIHSSTHVLIEKKKHILFPVCGL